MLAANAIDMRGAILTVIVLLGSCSVAKHNTQMYTYDVQYVDFRTDETKDMGPIDAASAVPAFRSSAQAQRWIAFSIGG
jgi:hypothetical protein